jgi:hypothetical protein
MIRSRGNTIKELEPRFECCHHWIIESTDGPTSWGLCKYCGAEKEFLNHFTKAQPDSRFNSEIDFQSSEVGSSS